MQRHAPGILYKALTPKGIARLLGTKEFFIGVDAEAAFFSRDREAGVKKTFCIAAVEGGGFRLEMGGIILGGIKTELFLSALGISCGRSCIGAPGICSAGSGLEFRRSSKQRQDWGLAADETFFLQDFLFLILLVQRDTGLASRR